MQTVTFDSHEELRRWVRDLAEELGRSDPEKPPPLGHSLLKALLESVLAFALAFFRAVFFGGTPMNPRSRHRDSPRTWRDQPPNIIITGPGRSRAAAVEILQAEFGLGALIELPLEGASDHPNRLNYLLSVVDETPSGRPFVLENAEYLTDRQARLIKRAADGGELPYFDKDGEILAQWTVLPIILFATTETSEVLPHPLRSAFSIHLDTIKLGP